MSSSRPGARPRRADPRARPRPAEPGELRQDDVHDQLAPRQIQFSPASALKPNENDPCLKNYAGQQLVTGKQAQCYADHYIACTWAKSTTARRTPDEQRPAGAARPDQRRGEGVERQGPDAVPARRSAVCCSPAMASASSVTAPDRRLRVLPRRVRAVPGRDRRLHPRCHQTAETRSCQQPATIQQTPSPDVTVASIASGR